MKNPYLCLVIVCILGGAGGLCIAGMVLLQLYGQKAPESLIAIASAAFGSLASFLVQPPKGQHGGAPIPTVPPLEERIRSGL